jgi:hypothetical protein
MTDRELMQQVLEDICGARLSEVNSMSSRREALRLLGKAADALRERLAQSDQWQGLTADEMEGLYQMATYMDETDYIHMLMMAEAKLREKNT